MLPGGKCDRRISDNDLVTFIINPSHKIDSCCHKELLKTNGGTGSRMGNDAHIMTVQQTADIDARMKLHVEAMSKLPESEPLFHDQTAAVQSHEEGGHPSSR